MRPADSTAPRAVQSGDANGDGMSWSLRSRGGPVPRSEERPPRFHWTCGHVVMLSCSPAVFRCHRSQGAPTSKPRPGGAPRTIRTASNFGRLIGPSEPGRSHGRRQATAPHATVVQLQQRLDDPLKRLGDRSHPYLEHNRGSRIFLEYNH